MLHGVAARRRARCRSSTVLPGHGEPFADHAALIDERFAMHERRAREVRRADRRAAALRARRSRTRSWGNVARHAGLPDALRGARPRRPAGRARRGRRGRPRRASSSSPPRKWTTSKSVLVALLRRRGGAGRGGARDQRPVPDRARARRRAARAAARACRTSQLDPDLVLVLFLPPLLYARRVLRQPARPADRTCGRSRCCRSGSCSRRCWSSRSVAHALIDGLVVARGVRARRDRRADRPGGGDRDRAPPRRAAADRRRCSRASRWSTTRPRSSPTGSRSRAAAGAVAFSLLDAGWDFLWKAAGGIAIGLAVGWVDRAGPQAARRPADREHDRPADGLRRATCPPSSSTSRPCSAAVTVGCYVGWQAPQIASARHAPAGLRDVGAAAVPAQRAAVRADRAAAAGDPRRRSRARRRRRCSATAAAVSAAVVICRGWSGSRLIVFLIRAVDRRGSCQRAAARRWQRADVIAAGRACAARSRWPPRSRSRTTSRSAT